MFNISLGLLLFGINLTAIMLLLRRMKTSPAVLVCSSSILVYMVGLTGIGIAGVSINFFSFSALYWFLTLSMLMVFGAVYKSISLRMMLHLFNQPKKSDYYDAILQNYIKDQSYTHRIDILVQKKMIRESGETYSITKKGAFFARQLWLIQQVFSIKESG